MIEIKTRAFSDFPPSAFNNFLNFNMSSSKLKVTPPPKLESKNLTLDKLQTWFSGLKNCFKHDKDHKQFLKGEAHESWSALKTDPTRGITVDPGYGPEDDAAAKALKDTTAEEKAVKIRDSLDDFLHLIGSKSPDGMYNTIIREAVSMEWVLRRIKAAFRIQSKGVDLYDATETGFDEDKDDSYDISYLKIKDQFEDLLSSRGSKYHGESLATAEAMTPLCESMITIQWLKSIHPGLPKHIKDRHSHLFTDDKPNWADLQPDFVKMMDTLLAEVENKEEIDPSARIGRVGGRGRGRGRGFAQRNTSGFSRGGRTSSQSSSKSGQSTGRFCDICHAAGKPDHVVKSHSMPWCGNLSTHGRAAIASSMRMAFVDELDEVDEENIEDVDELGQDI